MGATTSTDHEESFETKRALPNPERYCQNRIREIYKTVSNSNMAPLSTNYGSQILYQNGV